MVQRGPSTNSTEDAIGPRVGPSAYSRVKTPRSSPKLIFTEPSPVTFGRFAGQYVEAAANESPRKNEQKDLRETMGLNLSLVIE